MRVRALTVWMLCLLLVPNVAKAQQEIQTDPSNGRGGEAGKCGPSTRPVAVYDEQWRYVGRECYLNGCSVGYCTCSPGYNCTVSGTCGCCFISEDLLPYPECGHSALAAREAKNTTSGGSHSGVTQRQGAARKQERGQVAYVPRDGRP